MNSLSHAATPQQARAKRVTRTALEICGGIDATTAIDGMPGKSQVGRWHSLNERDLPRVDYAAAMDEVAVAEGHEPPFATWFAHQVGRVLVDPPESEATKAGLIAFMSSISVGTGGLQAKFLEAIADGGVNQGEKDALRAIVARVQSELSAFDAALAKGDD